MGTISGVGQTGGATRVAPPAPPTTTNGTGPSATPSLLAEPVPFSGNLVIELAMLMTRADQQERENATKLEDAADAAAVQDNAARVNAILNKASDEGASAWAAGLGEIAGGALSLASAGVTDTKKFMDLHDTLARSSGLAPAAGRLFGEIYKSEATRDEAGAQKSQALAEADLRLSGRSQSESQAASQAIQQVQQYLQGILATNAATNGAATGYRG